MVVVGVSRHGRLRRLLAGTTGDRIAAGAGAIDVHLVTHDEVSGSTGRRPPALLSPLTTRRQVAGWLLAVALPALLTLGLRAFDDTDQLPLAEMALLAGTVLVALVGGLLPALLAAVVSFGALNWFFTPPLGTLTIAEPANLASLLVYVAVAAGVATVVDRASRRAADAVQARTEAATMTSLSRSVLTGQDTAEAITARVREVFGQASVALLEREGTGWTGWRRPATTRARHPTTVTPGSPSTTTTCSPCAATGCAPSTAGCSRRSPSRPAWCWSTGGCGSARSEPPRSRVPRRRRPPCCARSPTT